MVCFIILHYQVTEETETCIRSLDRLSGEKHVVIIDNASPNGSGRKLKEEYKDRADITVLLNGENSGFARGNNVGCDWARTNLDPDFYVVMNNDVEIPQEDFIARIERIYGEKPFAVLGPDIYSTTGRVHQSPKSTRRTTIEDARALQQVYRRKLDSRILTPLKCRLKQLPFVRALAAKKKSISSGTDWSRKYTNVPLHGSCFIFSREFAQKRENFFFPGTFFYCESEILDYECGKAGLLTVYDPSLKVLHHQNVSTRNTMKDELKRTEFMNRQNFQSILAFLECYDK